MEFIDIKEASKKWNLTEKRLTFLCRNGRIDGAGKRGNIWMIPVDAEKPLDGRTKEYGISEIKKGILPIIPENSYREVFACKKCLERYENRYKCEAQYTSFTPYPITFLGGNTDTLCGKSVSIRINKGIYFAYGPSKEKAVEVSKAGILKKSVFPFSSSDNNPVSDFADILKIAVSELNGRFPLNTGIRGVFNSEIPLDGVSYYVPFVISFLLALCRLNFISLGENDLIGITSKTLEKFFGYPCGLACILCELYCEKESLFIADLPGKKYENQKNDEKYDVLLAFGKENNNLSSMLYDDCKCLSYIVNALKGGEYKTFSQSFLKDISSKDIEEYKDYLPERLIENSKKVLSEKELTDNITQKIREGSFFNIVNENGFAKIQNGTNLSEKTIDFFNKLGRNEKVFASTVIYDGNSPFIFSFVSRDSDCGIKEAKESDEKIQIFIGKQE